MADADEAPGQHVQQEASQELICGEGHDLLLAAVSVVLPAEGDVIPVEADEAMVGDGDAMGIAGEIVKHVLGSAEGRLGIDDPVLAEELVQEVAKVLLFDKRSARAMELELVLVGELLETGDELASEETAEHAHRQEEAA